MTEQTTKTWEVILATGEVKTVVATRVELNPDNFSLVFYNGDSPVGAFLNFHTFTEQVQGQE